MVGATFPGRIDDPGAKEDVLVATGLVEIVVLQEHGGRQHHVGDLGGLGHELLVYAGEEIRPGEAGVYAGEIGRDAHGVGVLYQHGRYGWSAAQGVGVAREYGADARLVEDARRWIARVQALDQGLVPMIDGAVVVEGAAAFVPPGAGDGGDAACRVHIDGAVALAGEAVTEAQEGAWVRADERCHGFDGVHGDAGDRGGPLGRARGEVRFEFLRAVGVAR